MTRSWVQSPPRAPASRPARREPWLRPPGGGSNVRASPSSPRRFFGVRAPDRAFGEAEVASATGPVDRVRVRCGDRHRPRAVRFDARVPSSLTPAFRRGRAYRRSRTRLGSEGGLSPRSTSVARPLRRAIADSEVAVREGSCVGRDRADARSRGPSTPERMERRTLRRPCVDLTRRRDRYASGARTVGASRASSQHDSRRFRARRRRPSVVQEHSDRDDDERDEREVRHPEDARMPPPRSYGCARIRPARRDGAMRLGRGLHERRIAVRRATATRAEFVFGRDRSERFARGTS